MNRPTDQPDSRRTGKPAASLLSILMSLAAVVVIVAGLKASGDLILPFIFSLILTAVVYPIVGWFRRKKIPTLAAVGIVVVVIGAALVLQAGMVAVIAAQFSKALPTYQQRLSEMAINGGEILRRFGWDTSQVQFDQAVSPASVMKLVGGLLDALTAVLSQSTLVILTMAFMLFEVAEFSDKFKKAFGDGRKRMDGIAQGVTAVQRYLVIKTITSALTGILVMIGCWIIGLDFAMLWGLLAFALNYIPTIGSIVAAVPPILLAFIQLGPVSALLVTALSLAVNFGVGNVLEPRMMGRGLGLSSLVVFLSLVFWGWIWGPMGMLLSVPLTVVVKIMFEYHEETRPIAVLLGPAVREK